MAQKCLMTQEGLEKLKKELETLLKDKRQEVAEKLKEAISHGDLSENAAYASAKDEQAFVEGRIFELKEIIRNAEIIKAPVYLLRINGKEKKYTIVGATEADPKNGKISNESAVGKEILCRKPGDKFVINTPAGETEYEILAKEQNFL